MLFLKSHQVPSTPLPAHLRLLGDGPSYMPRLRQMLSEAKCFEDFEQFDMDILAKHMKAYRVAAKETIIQEGRYNGYLCVLVEGRLGVYKEDGHDHVKLISSIAKGRIFGEVSLIDDFQSSASVVAETEATFLLMTRQDFHRCCHDHPMMGVHLLHLIARMLSARLRATSGQLAEYVDV